MHCAACYQLITDKQFLVALGLNWHEFCLRCACCTCQLTDSGDRFYLRYGLLLCAIDYVRIFGRSGHCSLCSETIKPADWIMVIDKGRTLFSHLDCFACWKCGYRFCVGEPYHLENGLVVCNFDFKKVN
uniref:LIM zinc-binding domain-containing protein n=1 Tax=Meloidogyne enterolobii TaxID=390850 RepID=A0A6V7Y9F2_MELEN|nr:unnamed protein product [Meloidogyne enterolobii]